ncbi:MAG: MATE family efflux transporter [Roseburia inulinivorans]
MSRNSNPGRSNVKKSICKKNFIYRNPVAHNCLSILSRFIGFFYKIFLSRTIGAEGLGIYQLIFPVMALCFSLTSAGIQTSVSRFVSSEIGKQNPAGARFYLLIGLILSVCLSVFTALFMWNHSEFIAGSFLQETHRAPADQNTVILLCSVQYPLLH